MLTMPEYSGDPAHAVDWFIDDMVRGQLTVFDADAVLAQLRLAGDVRNLERLSRALTERG